MERPLNTINLSNGQMVKIISFLTWGEKEKIEKIILSGVKVNNAGVRDYDFDALDERQNKLLTLCIKEIITPDGSAESGQKSEQFSREWIENLSVDDGDLVFETVDALTKKKV